MTIGQILAGELQHEAAATKKMFELLPFDKATWKPHEKSMTLGHLASHIAELPLWISLTVEMDELDFSKFDYKPSDAKTTEELIAKFDESMKKAVNALSNCSDEEMMKNWTLRNGETVYFTMPRAQVMRGMNYNHLFHHRGQLSVYLRMLNVPLPAVYGPTADDTSGMG
ncbi:MAG: DinB family protein [Ignavibacteriae bacterium]|jgi:uncharacterized damage-inducible protein DinB|nr:DinB family protein [Ignavibacteriota bacterium]